MNLFFSLNTCTYTHTHKHTDRRFMFSRYYNKTIKFALFFLVYIPKQASKHPPHVCWRTTFFLFHQIFKDFNVSAGEHTKYDYCPNNCNFITHKNIIMKNCLAALNNLEQCCVSFSLSFFLFQYVVTIFLS